MEAQHRCGREDDPREQFAELTIEEEVIPLTARYSLMFLEQPDGPATPVLYFDGRRVIRAWSLKIKHAQPADQWGISGGRD